MTVSINPAMNLKHLHIMEGNALWCPENRSEYSAGNLKVTYTRTSSAQHESQYGNHKDVTQTCALKIVKSHYLYSVQSGKEQGWFKKEEE